MYLQHGPEILFTENETNAKRLFGIENSSRYVKDGINDFVVHRDRSAVNPENAGTKAAGHYQLEVGAGQTISIKLRLTDRAFSGKTDPFDADFDQIFLWREQEADEFYEQVIPDDLSLDGKNVMRQSIAGLLWSKQFYHYTTREWLHGDPAQPAPPRERKPHRLPSTIRARAPILYGLHR